ncbi:hypothetical protein P8452_67915 [Trifolium repens]|nr:hypothetical protein P8452_67915 [Trifolium repens]
MDQRELNLQHVGICYKLYNFIMKTLVAQTLKTVTLGTSSNYGSRSSIGVPISNATQRDSNKMARLVTPCGGVNSNELQTNQSFFNDGILLMKICIIKFRRKLVSINDETISF